jgi:nitroreductase
VEFQDVINKRKMIRSFQTREIEEYKLNKIINNMFKGPSAGFSQGIEILVLNTPEQRELFYKQWGEKSQRKTSYNRWPKLENAPVIIIVCSHKKTYLDRYAEPDKGWIDKDESRWQVPYWDIDAGMSALLGLLTVVDLELGAVFTGVKDHEFIHKKFQIPDSYSIIGAISIGYPKGQDPPSPSLKRGRRSLEELVHYGIWQ